MSQKNKGIYSLLSNTFFYSLVQRVMSGTSFREKIVRKYITKHNVKVLDIGCGEGGLIKQLEVNIHSDTRGIEIDPELTQKAIAEGLNVVQGCKMAEAKTILGIDVNPDREILGKKFGMTDFINPKKVDNVVDQIIQITGGVDYSFECIGNVDVMRQAHCD